MSAPQPPRLLFVCTANMNRSPAAEFWARKHFADRFVSADVRSAGTHARDGGEAAANTVAAMHEQGFDLRTHRTRRLDRAALDWADAVVVMEPMHRDVILAASPEHAGKIVPLWPLVDPACSFVSDPHGGSLDAHRASAAELGRATLRLVDDVLAERRRRRQKGS